MNLTSPEELDEFSCPFSLQKSSPAPAHIVNGAGNQLFARACLSENQNRGIGWRHALYPTEDEFKGSAIANDLFTIV